MKKMSSLLPSIVAGALAGLVVALLVINYWKPSKNQLIKSFYDVETAVMVSPHGLRKKMIKGDDSFLLVDVRSQEEYENGHIIGAVNIPAYHDPERSAYDDVDRIVSEFAKLPKDKDVIVYCYSIPCMTGRKVGKMLADHNIYVKELGIGWNEWRYYWKLWNHEHEWERSKPEDYIWTGSEPGKFELKDDAIPAPCVIDNEFDC